MEPKNIRNVAVLGHQGSGKTSFVESLAYKAGAIAKKGSVETKDTISDTLPYEKKRMCSVSSSVVPLEYKGHKINLIDVPGNDDFIYETLGITRLVKGAVLLVDASKGVQIGTVKHFRQLKKRGVPMFIYVNKMDKDYVDFPKLLSEIQEKLDPKKCIPFLYPVGRKENFDGFINLVDLKARKYDGKDCVDDVIYDDKKQLVFEYHNRICESVAMTDDSLLEKFFSGEPLTNEEIRIGVRKSVLDGEIYPVLVGSALKDIGTNTVLQMLIDYLPCPSDLKPYKATDRDGKEIEVRTSLDEPVSLIVFKNIFDPYKGIISYFKVNSGVLHLGDQVIDLETEKTYRVTSLFSLFGEKLIPAKEIGAGDIGAFNKLGEFPLSTTLSSPERPLMFKKTKYPSPTYFRSIVPETKNDSDKLFPLVERVRLEDPSVSIERNGDTGEFLLGDASSSHMDYILEKLRDEYKLKFRVEVPKILYKETITVPCEAEGRYIKQSGGSGFYGVVDMRFEPAEETSFESRIFGGHIDKGYIPAVEKGFYEALKQGGLVKGPVIRVKAILLDGKQHPVDSNELAFKNAAILAFKEAYKDGKPVLLEPYYRLTIHVSTEYLGTILSDLSKRRARILSTEEEDEALNVISLVPQAEILDYTNLLKAMSKSTAFFNMEFDSYQQVPPALQEELLAKLK
jgi:elongation factor G